VRERSRGGGLARLFSAADHGAIHPAMQACAGKSGFRSPGHPALRIRLSGWSKRNRVSVGVSAETAQRPLTRHTSSPLLHILYTYSNHVNVPLSHPANARPNPTLTRVRAGQRQGSGRCSPSLSFLQSV
jgi:hypothetical protein